MNKTVMIYESKYGFTRQYAHWISEELDCPIFTRKEFRPQDFTKYEVIIYGGGLYAGGISGIKLITEHPELLSGKNIVVFTCGIADPKNPDNIANIKKSMTNIFSPEVLERIQTFHLRGGINYPRLSLIHKAMMAMLRRMLLKKDKKDLRAEDRLLLETYGNQIDFTDRNSIQPLTDYVKSIKIK